MPRAENNSKVSAFITLRPRWKVSFVATKLFLSRAAATQPARRRCSFPRARPKCYSSLGEIILRCRTIFPVGCKPAITSRFSTTPRSEKCPAAKSWNRSNWKIPRLLNAASFKRRPFLFPVADLLTSDLRPLTSDLVSLVSFRLNAFEQFGVRSIQVVSEFHRCFQSFGIHFETFSQFPGSRIVKEGEVLIHIWHN